MKENELLALKTKIDTAKTQLSQLEGQLQVHMKQLLKDFKCRNLEEAETDLKDLKAKSDKVKKEIDELTKELEEELNNGPENKTT